MKKISNYIFVGLILTCVGMGIFLITKRMGNNLNGENPTKAEGNVLSVIVLDNIEMLQGTQKNFYYSVNISLATIEVSIENQEIAIIDEDFNIFALNCGTTNCNLIATYENQTVLKTTQIVVEEKEVTFCELNQSNFSIYKSGVKTNNTYNTYTLQISANFDLSESSLSLDESILITNTTFQNQNQSVIIQYNLLYEGKFEFLIEGFSFSNTATNYISSLNLDFSAVEIVNNEITLYNLICEKETAYQDNKYDYAELTELDSFEVLIENSDIVSYDNLTFNATNVGQTNVTFRANDGSGFEVTLTVNVEEVYANSCQINLQNEVSLLISENFVVELTDFLPTYSTVNSITLSVGENLSVVDMTISANAVGSGWLKVFLNGNLIHEIQVTVCDLPNPITNYSISIIPPSQVNVDMENMTINLPLGLVQLRVYIYDEQNNFAEISVEIISGSSVANIEGNTIIINSINNSILRIYNNENNTYYDFILIIV